MSQSKTRRRLWFIGLTIPIVLIVIAGIVIWRNHYTQAEQRVLHFCQMDLIGDPVAKAHQKANNVGLTPISEPVVSQGSHILSVEYRSAFLPILSVCTLRSDGITVTAISYDPWYH